MKDLQVTVLAEGVEKEEQMKFLREVGCHYAQGYSYARPMMLEKAENLLMEEHGHRDDVPWGEGKMRRLPTVNYIIRWQRILSNKWLQSWSGSG